jgi:hypothetical protein
MWTCLSWEAIPLSTELTTFLLNWKLSRYVENFLVRLKTFMINWKLFRPCRKLSLSPRNRCINVLKYCSGNILSFIVGLQFQMKLFLPMWDSNLYSKLNRPNRFARQYNLLWLNSLVHWELRSLCQNVALTGRHWMAPSSITRGCQDSERRKSNNRDCMQSTSHSRMNRREILTDRIHRQF